MYKMKILKKIKPGNVFIILILALLIFYLSDSYRNKNLFEIKPNNLLEHPSNNSYSITQSYNQIKLEQFDSIILKIIERMYDYDVICFRDEGSFISEDAFKGSDLIISINYFGEEKIIASNRIRPNMKIPENDEQCFRIRDKESIFWTLNYYSDNPMTNSFINVEEFRNEILVNKISTYLKISNFRYISTLLVKLFLSILYAGIFFVALREIHNFIKGGFS
mgnify:CR=1 FL=1